MLVAALSWPQAVVYCVVIAAVAVVLSVLIWSIFRTGQAAIRHDRRQREPRDGLRREVDELRVRLEAHESQA
jgi:hypothetical protein